MKIKQLIRILNECDPEDEVVIRGYESGVNLVTDVECCRLALDVNKEDYYGRHEIVRTKDEGPFQIINAVHLYNKE